jgi:branched-chain amino acid transport system permease protein
MTARPAAMLAVGLGAAILFPLLAPNYLVNIGVMMFFVAFLGQSWNIAGGFAGQTSFGHVVFFGTGAYTSTILHVTYGWNSWPSPKCSASSPTPCRSRAAAWAC